MLRHAPLPADKSFAIGSPDFDVNMINSQWSIFNMSGSSKAEYSQKVIKKKTPKKNPKGIEENASLVPAVALVEAYGGFLLYPKVKPPPLIIDS